MQHGEGESQLCSVSPSCHQARGQGLVRSLGDAVVTVCPGHVKDILCPEPLAGSQFPLPVPAPSAAGWLQIQARWLRDPPGCTQPPGPCPSAMSRTQPKLFP